MKRKFVVTQNVKRFVDLMDTLKNAPANLPKMALVYGDFRAQEVANDYVVGYE